MLKSLRPANESNAQITPEIEDYECVDDGISVPKRAKKDFFHTISSSNRNLPVDLEVDNFLNDPLKIKESILKFPKLKNMFIRYNTALPSSASVERLFSLGGQIFKPTRNRLSDEKFEQFVFLKMSKNM